MAIDRIVRWWAPDTPRPSHEEVGTALRKFLGDFARTVEWANDRWIATLVGKKSAMFGQLHEETSRASKTRRPTLLQMALRRHVHDIGRGLLGDP